MFEKASKLKLRFGFKGQISVEDLWDLNQDDLDTIYTALNKEKKSSDGEFSLKRTRSSADDVLELKLGIVKRIFEVKEEEKAARVSAAAKREKKRSLEAILISKKEQELHGKTAEEIQKMIDEL
jgi:hypothetical protein